MAYNPLFDPEVEYTSTVTSTNMAEDTPIDEVTHDFDENSRYKDVDLVRVTSLKIASGFPKQIVIDISDALATFTVRAGDTFESKSYKYYGTTKYWWAIASANNYIYPFLQDEDIGKTIYVPKIESIPEVLGG